MKKMFVILALAWMLTSCAAPYTSGQIDPAEEVHLTEPTQTLPPATTQAPAVPTEPPVPLAIPGVSADDAVLYFSEVCLDAEFSDSEAADLVQKWASPILYTINGSPTEEDLQTFSVFVDWLNDLEGFPGLAEASTPELMDLRIHFCTEQELLAIMGSEYAGTDGAVTFWFNDDNIIYDAVICIRSDLDQEVRNSVILEELYNCLGPVQDTLLREDSLIYQDYSTPQWLTPVDELILRLLYHPDIKPGMNQAECEQVIRSLYQ